MIEGHAMCRVTLPFSLSSAGKGLDQLPLGIKLVNEVGPVSKGHEDRTIWRYISRSYSSPAPFDLPGAGIRDLKDFLAVQGHLDQPLSCRVRRPDKLLAALFPDEEIVNVTGAYLPKLLSRCIVDENPVRGVRAEVDPPRLVNRNSPIGAAHPLVFRSSPPGNVRIRMIPGTRGNRHGENFALRDNPLMGMSRQDSWQDGSRSEQQNAFHDRPDMESSCEQEKNFWLSLGPESLVGVTGAAEVAIPLLTLLTGRSLPAGVPC